MRHPPKDTGGLPPFTGAVLLDSDNEEKDSDKVQARHPRLARNRIDLRKDGKAAISSFGARAGVDRACTEPLDSAKEK